MPSYELSVGFAEKKKFYDTTAIDNKFSYIDNNYYDQNEIISYFYSKTYIDNNYYRKKNTTQENYYTFDVIAGYYNHTTIDDKFYAIDQALNDNYYTQTDINDNYYDINKIKDIVNKMLNGLKWRDGNTYDENYDQFYNGNVTIQQAIDHLGDTLIRDNADTIEAHKKIIDSNVEIINNNIQTITNQQILIEANKQSIAEQQNFIEANKTEILNKILELKKTVIKNQEEIYLNKKEVRPLAEVTTKIFNTLAAQANEEISLNTEVIEDNNELLNKMNKNNEADNNNALYVIVTALTAPFIGLSLYYSSDTEENIDNEIEAF